MIHRKVKNNKFEIFIIRIFKKAFIIMDQCGLGRAVLNSYAWQASADGDLKL